MTTPRELIAQYATQSQLSSFFIDKVGLIIPESYDAVGDGSTVDTTAFTDMISDAPTGSTIYLPSDKTYMISTELSITKKLTFLSNGATLKFAASYVPVTAGTLGMFNISASGVIFDGIKFDGSAVSNSATNNRFLWFTSSKGEVRNCEFLSLPDGGSNFNGAVGFSSASSEGLVENCRFNDCPGSAFTQGPRTRFINCISTAPKDVSYALNSANCIGSSVIGCKVYANNLTCSIHIGAEEGASKFTITDNYVYGVKDGIGIGAINVAVFTIGIGGVISNNIIDGGSFTTTNPCSLIKVSKYYQNIKIHDNILLNTPISGNANTVTVSISAYDNEFFNNKIVEDATSSFLASVYVEPAGGQLTLANNDIKARGTGRIVYCTTGDNSSKPLVSKNNWYRNTNSEGINITQPTNMPLYVENDNFDTVTTPINGTSWQAYFNSYTTYKFPHNIRQKIVMYGNAAPTSGTWGVGDKIFNYAPGELGGAGSKYIINAWTCTVAGTPGTWLEQRTLTGN